MLLLHPSQEMSNENRRGYNFLDELQLDFPKSPSLSIHVGEVVLLKIYLIKVNYK